LTRLFFQCSKLVVVVSALLILLTRFIAIGRGTNSDLLAYTIGWQPTSLMLYDFSNGSNTQIFSSSDSITFSLSADGRIAYTSRESGEGEVYILNTGAADSTLINITQTPTTNEFPSAWSPDGRYLAFVSNEKERPQLYIWDGVAAINITPNDTPDMIQSYQSEWSINGRLAVTIRYGFSVEQNTEIYSWDGKTTTNLSQNPLGMDGSPVWNADGRIAFLSERDSDYDIYIWDGVSLKDGAPDRDSYTNAAPELTGFMSSPTWTNEGLLSFAGFGPHNQNARLQIYVWDGQTVTNIRQNRTLERGVPHWSRDGRLVISPYGDPWPKLNVYDTNYRLLLRVVARSGPAWSSDGYLMFCTPVNELAIWDGRLIVKLTPPEEIVAKWGNGEGVVCSTG
jgi:Tol biopolymer transport system component